MKIVVDSAHGAAYNIAPHVFHELGAEVISIGASPDGFNINAGFGATAPKALSAAVVEHKADLGIALDGDADRLIMVDATGRVYNGDELLYLMVRDRMCDRPGRGRRRHPDDEYGAGSGLQGTRHRLRARESRRPLCARSHAGTRLDPGRGGLRPPAGPGQAHHRRRHRLVAAGVVGPAPQRQVAGSLLQRAATVSRRP